MWAFWGFPFGQSFITIYTLFIFLFSLSFPHPYLSPSLSLSSIFKLFLSLLSFFLSFNLMSNKMKKVAFDSSSRVSYDDLRARFKHQTLVQDYLELQQETEAARNRLEVMKQKKHTLEAEVRFLRRRYKFLMKTRSLTPQVVRTQNVEITQYKSNKKEKANPKKVATLPLNSNQIQSGKTNTTKKNIIPSRPSPVFDLDRNVNPHGNNSSPMIEINQKSAVVQAKAPIFDLNQISIEEEELQEGFKDQRTDQQNDLKLSICRNVVDGSTNRSGKRKISWQDPVALRV